MIAMKVVPVLRYALVLIAALAVSACGGSGPATPTAPATLSPTPTGTPNPTPSPSPTPTTVNTAAIVMDAGPAALSTGTNGYAAFNEPYVTITLCAPGSTTNCQTIDHVILDTGSVGLRVLQPVISPSLLAAMPTETDSSGNAVGECYQYVNSYAFGSVRKADFTIAGETVAGMPLQVVADTGTFSTVPSSCSSGGGSATATVQDLSANAIIGVGTTPTDCGGICTVNGGQSAAIYYDCPNTGCATIIGLPSTASAPFGQLPNPVAAFPSDNNGTVITLPSVREAGTATLTGTVTFGIDTQPDNTLGSANVLPLTTSTSRFGPGNLTATYNGKTLTQSFLDTGSNEYYFIDSALTACTGSYKAFYCPPAPASLSPLLTATNANTASGAFILYNPNGVFGTSTVAPGLGVNPTLVTPPLPFSNSFDFGVPFFFGKTVYTAIEGTSAGSVPGPFVAW